MKIVILSPAWPYRGGIAKFTHRLARELQAEGHRVDIENFSLLYPSLLFPGKSQYDDLPQPKDLSIRRSINAINPISWIRTGWRLRKGGYDLCVVIYYLPALAPALASIARLIKGNGKTRVVGMLHNLYPHETRPLDKTLINYLVRSCHAFVTLSSAVDKQLEALLGKLKGSDEAMARHEIAFHPIYDSFGEKPAREEAIAYLNEQKKGARFDCGERYLLFFGFIRKYKGLDLLLRAVGQIKEELRRRSVKFVIAGEFYDSADAYLPLAKELDINDRIVWENEFIADQDVRHYFGMADAVVFPYRSATQSGVTQIAFHFSLPMVLTRVGALPEIVPDGECGIVCEPSVEGIAEGIMRYLNADRSELVAGVNRRKQLYSWSYFAAKVVGVANS